MNQSGAWRSSRWTGRRLSGLLGSEPGLPRLTTDGIVLDVVRNPPPSGVTSRETSPLWLLAALVAAALLCSLPSPARAEPAHRDEAARPPVWLSLTPSFGAIWLDNPFIREVYGPRGRFSSRLRVGFVPWNRYVHVETAFSASFVQFTGEGRTASGAPTGDRLMMTIHRFALNLQVGIDAIDEQPVVPYGGVGLVVVLWSERVTDGRSWAGDRFGGSAFFGLDVLLDGFWGGRSERADLEDVFLSVEARWSDVQTLFDGTPGGLGFGGWSVHGGVKLVFPSANRTTAP